MLNISGFGLKVTVLAIQTFPMGFTLSEFADDVDPIAIEETQPSDFEMLYDGSLFAFEKAAPILASVSVIPGSDDDMNLRMLLQAKKGARSLFPVEDITSMVISYPGGGRVTLTEGTILKGPLADSVIQSGRKKGNTYSFAFGSFAGMQSGLQTALTIGQNVLGLL
jgi:hypothetical protein